MIKRKKMFQLNSSNGKFDIVFTEVPHIDENAKLHGIRATSAGRRKNQEWKSKLFEKKVKDTTDGNKVRSNRTTKLRLEKEKKQRKHGRLGQTEKDEKLTENPLVSDKQKSVVSNAVQGSLATENSVHNPPSNEQDQMQTLNQVSHDYNSAVDSQDTMNPPVHNKNTSSSRDTTKSNPRLRNKNTSSEQTFNRRNTFTTNPNGFISQVDLASLYQNFLNEKREEEAKNESSMTKKYEEDHLMSHDVDKHQETFEPFISPREKLIREKQATPVEDYYPWGKPGCGAPIKTENPGVIRSAIKRNKRYWDENELSQEGDIVEEPELSSPSSGHTNQVEKSSFIRGKGKTMEELEEAEQRRMKQMEHEKAIAKQVEDKRRKKQLEKEQKWREEQEAEEKFQREQEMFEKRLKEEQRKQLEKEEERRRKQEAVEEGIRKATEEALKAKEETRKARQHSSTKEENPMSSRKLHDDNEVVTPHTKHLFDEFQLKFDGSDDEKSHTPSTVSKIPKPTRKTVRKPVKQQPTPEDQSHSDGGNNNLSKEERANNNDESPEIGLETKEKTKEHKAVGKNDGIKTVDRTRQLRGPASRVDPETKMKTTGKREKRVKKPEISEISPRTDESPKDNPKRRGKQGDCYLVPFHRTNSECLITDQVEMQPETKRKESENSTLSEHFANPESPTSRQQQILNQLETLRKGLLQKQQEYGGYFNTPYT